MEALEDRALLSVSVPIGPIASPATHMATTTSPSSPVPTSSAQFTVPPAFYDHSAIPVGGGGGIVPMFVTGSMTPSQIRTAYGLNPAITIGGVSGDGAGQTIAIVDAYQNTHITTDLATFDSNFGISAPPSFSVLNQSGGTDLSGVAADSGWALEIALDVEWAHAIAPAAKIVLFEANDNSNGLYTAVSTARSYAGVSVVSMSWGGSEFLGETFFDSAYFTTPSGHSGVTFVASTGDNGAPGGYPSFSPNVLAIGGTTVDIQDSSGTYNTETGWSGSGGGISSQESRPSYQNALQTNSSREVPDVSFDASDSSNVLVYDAGWYDVWGTSLAAPCWAGLIAITDQFRANAGLAALNPSGNPTQAQSLLYSLAGSTSNFNPLGYYHDVTSGTSTGSPNYTAATGYDMVTGIGSPRANLLLPALALGATPGTPDLAASYDTGVSNTDNITSLNNHNSLTELQFTVPNTVSGATITLYADGTAIGSATASAATTTITTTGSFTLSDGNHLITSRQTVSGLPQSPDSAALAITIDTTPPTVTVNQAAGQADPVRVTSTINFSAVFSEQVFGLTATSVTLGGTAGATNVVVTNPSNDHINYNIAVSGMAQPGTVIVSLAAAVAQDAAGNASTASSSTDNTVTVVGTTRTWTGGGADNNWTTAANWADGAVPMAGDALVFAGGTRLSANDNFPRGTVFDSITFANGGFTLTSGSVKLTPASGIAINNVAGQNGISLTIASASTGTVVVQAGSLRLGLSAQSIALTGGADIQAGKLLFDYTGGATPAGTILPLLRTSYHGGAWDTGTFRSSKAAVNGTTLGWKDDAGSSQLTVMATVPGDFNLDGTADNTDRAIWFANAMTGATWAQGDANYDGTVNGLDRDILMANLSRSVSAASSGAVLPASMPASVSSPANASDVSASNNAAQAARDAVFAGLATTPGSIGDGSLDGGVALADFDLVQPSLSATL
jgi:hypothetical protein